MQICAVVLLGLLCLVSTVMAQSDVFSIAAIDKLTNELHEHTLAVHNYRENNKLAKTTEASINNEVAGFEQPSASKGLLTSSESRFRELLITINKGQYQKAKLLAQAFLQKEIDRKYESDVMLMQLDLAIITQEYQAALGYLKKITYKCKQCITKQESLYLKWGISFALMDAKAMEQSFQKLQKYYPDSKQALTTRIHHQIMLENLRKGVNN